MKIFKSRQQGISIFRILLAVIVVRNLFSYMNYSDLLFGVDGIAPFERYSAIMKMYGLSFMEWTFQGIDPMTYLWAVVALALLFAMGIGKWFIDVLFFIALLNLQLRNQFILDGSDNVILVSLPFIILASRGSKFLYNWPRFKFEEGHIMDFIRSLATIGFIVQICIIYFSTGLVKANIDVWNQGIANYYILQLHEFEATKWNILLAHNHLFVKLTTYGTLVFEILFPIAILYRKTKYLWLVIGVLFHLGIWIFMKIDVFPWIMIATYFVFITDEEYDKIWTRIKDRMQIYLHNPAVEEQVSP